MNKVRIPVKPEMTTGVQTAMQPSGDGTYKEKMEAVAKPEPIGKNLFSPVVFLVVGSYQMRRKDGGSSVIHGSPDSSYRFTAWDQETVDFCTRKGFKRV